MRPSAPTIAALHPNSGPEVTGGGSTARCMPTGTYSLITERPWETLGCSPIPIT
ncbi:unnamed protein product [Ixodes hexagonus]